MDIYTLAPARKPCCGIEPMRRWRGRRTEIDRILRASKLISQAKLLHTGQALFSNPGMSQRLVFAMSGDAKGSLIFELAKSCDMPHITRGA
jgi:hypothetical protein